MNQQYIEQKSFYQHPKYNEFLVFLNSLKTDARKNPNALNLAFDVWSKTMTELCGERWLETGSPFMSDKEQIEKLKADLDRLHRERDSFQQQARVLAEEVERLQDDLKRAGDALSGALIGLCGQEFGELGEACLSIDGGNL